MSVLDDNVSPITGNRMLPRRMPTTKEANPGCWAMDGNYLGATPLTWWDDCRIGSLVHFGDDARFVIGMAVLHEWTPPVWIECVGASIPARAWWEWHWYRGIDPFLRREPIPSWMRRIVIDRDGYVCGLCGGDVDPDDVHLDHIVPVTLGGQNEAENLQVTHSLCNLKKGNRILVARSHAIVHSSILDSDLSERSVPAQLLYRQLLERPERGTLGVIPYRPRSWAKYMPGFDAVDVEGLVVELEAHEFLVVDRDELEVIHRTHMHHDGVLKQAQVVMAAAKQRSSVESPIVGAAIDEQIPPALRDRWPDAIANGKRAEVQAWLEECSAASYKPTRKASSQPETSPTEGFDKPNGRLEPAQRQAPGTGTGSGSGVGCIGDHLQNPPASQSRAAS